MFLLGFPLLIVPLVAYNILTFLVPVDWAIEIASVPLLSPAVWRITVSDALFAAALLLLLVEVVKATRMGRRAIVDHVLSVVVFGAALAEFLLVEEAGNSLFAFLVFICLIDVIAGLVISIRTGERRRLPETDDYLSDYPPDAPVEQPLDRPRAV